MDAEPLIRLTAEIKNDLIRKLDLFLNRSEEERDKILVFTDDPTLWTEYSNPSIRLDTLPPIPEDYQLRPGYDIVREMSAFLKRYCTVKKYVLCWCLAVRGEEDKPEVHVLFYEDIKTPQDMIPIYSSDNVLHSDLPRDGPPYCPPSALPAAVKAEMWREHHQDSTLNDVSSSVFSMSFPCDDSSSGKVQKARIHYHDDKLRRGSSTDSEATMPPDDPTLLHHDDEISSPSDYASGPPTGSSKGPSTGSTSDFSTGSSAGSASKLGDPK